jgi:hypothetical protein
LRHVRSLCRRRRHVKQTCRQNTISATRHTTAQQLQTLRRQNVPFLYARSSGPRITLLPGVAFNLRRFGALIQLLARSAWVQHIRSNPRNAPTVGGATDLELFLFGGARVDLSAARPTCLAHRRTSRTG